MSHNTLNIISPSFHLSFPLISQLSPSLFPPVGGVSHGQSTGNVWVTHEEMESMAATPPTVSFVMSGVTEKAEPTVVS